MNFIESFNTLQETNPSLEPYVIAEIGSNFDQSKDKAFEMIEVAADCGADAVKFQLFNAESLYPDRGQLYDLFKSLELNPLWLADLMDKANSLNVEFFCSPFDVGSVHRLEEISVVAHKVASSELTNHRLLVELAKTDKPILLSTGMSTYADIEDAVRLLELAGNQKYSIMQCVANYPLAEDEANLGVITKLKNRYHCSIGYSDHTLGHDTALIALGLGAQIFEKHITLDRGGDGPDHSYAMEPPQFKEYCNKIKQGFKAIGSGKKKPNEFERLNGRRSGLYVNQMMKEGDMVHLDNLEVKRPALGIPERYREAVVGTRLVRNLQVGDPLDWSDLE